MCSAKAEAANLSADVDLSSKARIRNTALRLFGRDGVAKTSVRSIAGAAGVSPALIIHHFGSKEGLRRACDSYVVEDLVKKNQELTGSDVIGVMRQWLAEPERFRSAFDYLTRMVLDGSDTGIALFADMVARTEEILAQGEKAGHVRKTEEPYTRAILVAAFGMMPLLLENHFGHLLKTDGLDAEALNRLTVPSIELLTNGLYADDSYLDAAKAALEGDQSAV